MPRLTASFHRLLLLLIIVTSTAFSGCGVIRDRSSDYVSEKETSGVVVPDGYEQGAIGERYPITSIINNQVLPEEYEVPSPPDATLHILKKQFSVEANDTEVWLLINEPPSRVWPSLERFFGKHGVLFEHADPQKGLAQGVIRENSVLGSAFAESVSLPVGKDIVVMIRISQGLKRNSSEAQVRLLQDADPAVFYPWGSTSLGLVTERLILEKAKEHMAENKDKKSFSLLASDIGGPTKVSLVSDENHDNYLQLDLDYDRAWTVVLRSVRDAGYPVADIDRSEGIVYLDVRDNDEKCAFFSFFCSDEKVKPEYDYKLQLSDFKSMVKVHVINMVNPEDRDSQAKILAALLENAS